MKVYVLEINDRRTSEVIGVYKDIDSAFNKGIREIEKESPYLEHKIEHNITLQEFKKSFESNKARGYKYPKAEAFSYQSMIVTEYDLGD